jgi:hypothetical protein
MLILLKYAMSFFLCCNSESVIEVSSTIATILLALAILQNVINATHNVIANICLSFLCISHI